MTLNDIVKRIKDRSHRGDVDVTTDAITAQILRAINDARRKIIRRVPKDFLRSTGTISVVSSTTTYSLASDVQEPIVFRYSYLNNEYLLTKVESEREFYQEVYKANATAGKPSHYIELGLDSSGYKQIQVYPSPDASYTVTYAYYKDPSTTELTTSDLATAVPDIPSYLQDALVEGALWLFLKGFDDAAQLAAKQDFKESVVEADIAEDRDEDLELSWRIGSQALGRPSGTGSAVPSLLAEDVFISGASPSLTFQDTTSGDLDAIIDVDGDYLGIRESASPAGRGINIDLSSNYVGLGTQSPDQQLDVDGSIQMGGDLLPEATGTRNLGSSSRRFANLYMASNIDYSSALTLTSGSELFRFTTDGKLGIGTTSPSVDLEISNSSPKIQLTDTTASAKSLVIQADANKANLMEASGSLGSLLVLDLANNRIGVGVASPTVALDVSGTTKATLFSGSGASLTALNADNISSGTLLVARGGTGAATLTGILHGNGTSAVTAGNVALGSEVTGTLPVANGGTNSASALSGSSIMVSNGSAVIQGSAGTSTTVLHGNASGTPTYSAVNLTAAADITGTLPIANGGTGATTLLGANIPVLNVQNSFTGFNTFGAAGVTAALKFETLGTYRNGQAGFGISSIADTSLLDFFTARGTHASKTAITTGDGIASMSFRGYAGGTNGYVTAADIAVTNVGAVSDAANGVGASMTFRTRATGGNLTTALAIDENAKVTIGTGGTALSVVSISTYTPTLTSVANVDSTTSAVANYIRIGSTVIVCGQLTVDPTSAANTATKVGISLPVASDLTSGATGLAGTCCFLGSQRGGAIYPDTANDRATLEFKSENTAAQDASYMFMYIIQ